ncbi:MAG TPA: hypothetical protein VF421_10910 [Niabella sp.]
MKILVLFLLSVASNFNSCDKSTLSRPPDVWVNVKSLDAEKDFDILGAKMKITNLVTGVPGIGNSKLITGGLFCDFTNNSSKQIQISKKRFEFRSGSKDFYDVSQKYKTGDSIVLNSGEKLEYVVLNYDSDKGISYEEYQNFLKKDTISVFFDKVLLARFVYNRKQ